MRKRQFVLLSILCVCVLGSIYVKYVSDDVLNENSLSNENQNIEDMSELTSEIVQENELYTSLDEIHPYSDGYVEIYRLNENYIYRAYFSKAEDIVVECSIDGGDTWERTSILYQGYGYGIYKVYLSFLDENTGYLLYCGEPACGQMSEVLFKTEDGGKSFVEVMDISNQIADYPNDMEFLTEDIGIIMMTYHGNGPVYYQTNNGGETWIRQNIELPETEFAYAQGSHIQRNESGQIEVIIELVSHTEDNKYVVYYTEDAVAWKMK